MGVGRWVMGCCGGLISGVSAIGGGRVVESEIGRIDSSGRGGTSATGGTVVELSVTKALQ